MGFAKYLAILAGKQFYASIQLFLICQQMIGNLQQIARSFLVTQRRPRRKGFLSSFASEIDVFNAGAGGISNQLCGPSRIVEFIFLSGNGASTKPFLSRDL